MPRKSYKPKNRFRPGSRINESTYLAMIFFWCHGHNFSEISENLTACSIGNEAIIDQNFKGVIEAVCEGLDLIDIEVGQVHELSRNVISRNIRELCTWVYLTDVDQMICKRAGLTEESVKEAYFSYRRKGLEKTFFSSLELFVKNYEERQKVAYLDMIITHLMMSNKINHDIFRDYGLTPIDVTVGPEVQQVLQ